MRLSFTLPLPPSVNADKVIAKGRRFIIKSKQRRHWENEAFYLLRDLTPQNPTDWALHLTFVFHYVESPRKKDPQNYLKALCDMIAQKIGIDDDRLMNFTVQKIRKKGREKDYVRGEVVLL